MSVRHLTYLDLTPEHRRAAAAVARKRLHEHLSSPMLTTEQAQAVIEKITTLDHWEAGTLPVSHPPGKSR